MAVRARFTANRAGINAACRTEGVYRHLEHFGDVVIIKAEATAPVDTGQYAFGTIEPGGFTRERFTAKGRVAGVRVTAQAPHSKFLEDGTRFMAARHILRNALNAAKLSAGRR
jgi:HK97 gp10 family phage protein